MPGARQAAKCFDSGKCPPADDDAAGDWRRDDYDGRLRIVLEVGKPDPTSFAETGFLIICRRRRFVGISRSEEARR
jgi:hypothetical protein